MGLLDGVLGGAIGAALTSAVTNLIERHGGVQGLVNELEQRGLGPAAKSWVGNGENEPVSPDQMHQAFGSDTLRDLAAKAGISTEELASRLSEILPQAVDKLTPNGRIA